MNDLISRKAAIDALEFGITYAKVFNKETGEVKELFSEANEELRKAVERIKQLPSAQQEQRWIPVSERLPENTEPVNITWVNRKPEPYYADIKDKPFTATGHYCNGRWWWYSAVCQDYLDEFGECEMDEMDGDIEVIAWMPLPEPYQMEV